MLSRTQSIIDTIEKYSAHHYRRYPDIVFDVDPRNKGVWVYDCEGRKCLDMFGKYASNSLGHNHPEIMKASNRNYVQVSHGFYTKQEADLLEALHRISGGMCTLLMNSGVEAWETAVKIARKWSRVRKGIFLWDTPEIIVAGHAFHGRTLGALSAMDNAAYRNGFGPFVDGFYAVPYGAIKHLEIALNPHTIAVILEPIQGEAGIIIPPEGYLAQVKELCQRHNILLIFDEVQTGLGRTGKMFAFQHENVQPDVLVLAKALGGSRHPVSAVLAPRAIMDVIGPGDHGSTNAGDALACAIGAKTIEILERTSKKYGNLVVNSSHLGAYLMHELKKIQSPRIKEVRGRGLFIGIELTEDAGDAFDWCVELLHHGVSCGTAHEHVIRVTPPLIITKKELDLFLSVFEDVVKKHPRK